MTQTKTVAVMVNRALSEGNDIRLKANGDTFYALITYQNASPRAYSINPGGFPYPVDVKDYYRVRVSNEK